MLCNNSDYANLLDQVKQEIVLTRSKTVSAVNAEVTCMYWRIGADLNEDKAYGTGYIDALAHDLRLAFPEIKWANARNLRYMAKFARETDEEILHTVYAKLSWSHNKTLMDRVKDGELRADGDRPTIGLLLCKTKNDVVAEYSLKDINQPIGVSEYRLGDELPEDYAAYLPSPADLQARI